MKLGHLGLGACERYSELYMRALFTVVTILLCQYTNFGFVKDNEVHTEFDALKYSNEIRKT